MSSISSVSADFDPVGAYATLVVGYFFNSDLVGVGGSSLYMLLLAPVLAAEVGYFIPVPGLLIVYLDVEVVSAVEGLFNPNPAAFEGVLPFLDDGL